MKYVFNYLYLIVALLIISCNSGTKSSTGKEQKDTYSAQIDSLIQTTNPRTFNGVILITQNGETKYLKAYGHSNFDDKTPITTEDNFRIQSNSKQITAVLVLKEVENGKISLKSPIRTYLPEIQQTWADTVTVHQLLNMSSGITGIDESLLFEPGTAYHYSNPAYGLLGRIIAKVTGEKYSEVANSLFMELKMNNSFCYELKMSENENSLVNGYRVSNDEFGLVKFNESNRTEEGWTDFVPAGGVISNLKDLNIRDSKLHNGNLLKPETYQLMITYTISGQHDAFGNEKIGYGYGLRIDDNKPLKIIGHAGRGLGFASIKFYIPEKKVAVIMLENVYNEDVGIVYHFEKKIREIVLNSSLVE